MSIDAMWGTYGISSGSVCHAVAINLNVKVYFVIDQMT